MSFPGRSFLKWSVVALLILSLSVAALYAMTPAIVSSVAPRLAERYGLAELELDIAHPGLRGVSIRQLTLATEQVRLTGRNARADSASTASMA